MDPLLRTALEAADAAAEVHRRHVGRVGVEAADEKGTSDFVSRVDLEAQEAALDVIRSRHPGHRILAEEEAGEPAQLAPVRQGRDDGSGNRTPIWVVDPLDGTTNYLHRHPMYSASVAVFAGGEPAAGAVSCAATGERWWAARGGGAYRDGRPIRVSGTTDLSRALVGTGFPFKVLDLLPRYQRQLGRVLRSTAGVRRGGSAAIDLCYLADGTFDAFWELYLEPWDVAAGLVIVREAGGVVTRLDGSEPGLDREGSILGANSVGTLEALRRLLADGA